jgi:hypothetical protein
MQVDNPPFGDLAEPGKRIAIAKLDTWQRPHRFRRSFLKNILRLDFPPQGLTQLPFDESHQRRTPLLQKISQGIGIVLANALAQRIIAGIVHGTNSRRSRLPGVTSGAAQRTFCKSRSRPAGETYSNADSVPSWFGPHYG